MTRRLTYGDTIDLQIEFAGLVAAVTKRTGTAEWLELLNPERVRAADSYFLNDDFASLVEQAAESLPSADTVIEESDFISLEGWMAFETPFRGQMWHKGAAVEEHDILGMYWEPGNDGHVMLWFRNTDAVGVGGYMIHLGTFDRFAILGTECPCRKELGMPPYWEQWFKALWLLLSQKNVSDIDDQALPRAARKRAIKAQAPSSVRVIRLPRHIREGDGGTHSVEWQHRWLVSGHWRKQPWGPERKRIRPMWIAPYVKGPDDKPLKDSAHRLFVTTNEHVSP